MKFKDAVLQAEGWKESPTQSLQMRKLVVKYIGVELFQASDVHPTWRMPELTVLRNNFQLSDGGSGSTVLFFWWHFWVQTPHEEDWRSKRYGSQSDLAIKGHKCFFGSCGNVWQEGREGGPTSNWYVAGKIILGVILDRHTYSIRGAYTICSEVPTHLKRCVIY